MEIKNKNIFLNLNDGEEILYIAEKEKFAFYFYDLPIIFGLLPIFSFFLFITVSNNAPFTLIGCILLILLFFIYFTYLDIRDLFYSDLVLTNKRILLSRFNKLISIDYSQIKYISGSSYRGKSGTTISLKSKSRFYLISFINPYKFKEKFKEIYIDYNDEKTMETYNKRGIIVAIALIILFPIFINFGPYFLSNKNSMQQKTEKSKIHSNGPELAYFKPYMDNLRNKIKRNWDPPKNKENNDVILKFKIARDGSLMETNIIKSSNSMAIDRAAIKALNKSAPFGPLPKQFKEESVDVEFTFDYNVLGRS